MLDLDSPLFRLFMERAVAYEFDGLCACIEGLEGQALVTAMLRWQNDQGKRMRQEYTSLVINTDRSIDENPDTLSQWLKKPAMDGVFDIESSRENGEMIIESVERFLDEKLSSQSSVDLHPENREIISAGWIGFQSAR